jgi:plasmid stability protein
MADILIRKVSETTKEVLRKRAERRGKSLEADLRETLERLAREEPGATDDSAPFGDWLVSITRPGIELAEVLDQLRAAPPRLPALE